MLPDHITRLTALFRPWCTDTDTLDAVTQMARDRSRWRDGHRLFDVIRRKTLAAERAGEGALAAQYLFEEVCAQSLYNLTNPSDPFDPDSPYWIIPNALAVARHVGVAPVVVLDAVAPK